MTQIGVIMNEKNEVVSLTEGIKIVIYENSGESHKWEKTRVIEFESTGFYPIENLKQMREFLAEIVTRLQECKILIGSIITGVPFMILDQKAIMLCEADTLSEELFSTIEADYHLKLQKIAKAGMELKQEKQEYPTAPYPTLEEGVYELDLRKLQEAHPEVSSKMALIPFLRTDQYQKLYVYCSHIMPWLDVEAMSLDIRYHGEKWKDGYRLEIQLR